MENVDETFFKFSHTKTPGQLTKLNYVKALTINLDNTWNLLKNKSRKTRVYL